MQTIGKACRSEAVSSIAYIIRVQNGFTKPPFYDFRAGRFYLGIRYDLDEFRDVYDHQAIRFSNWRRGEPNNHRYTLEKEVEMHADGSWNDREGNGRRITICIKT